MSAWGIVNAFDAAAAVSEDGLRPGEGRCLSRGQPRAVETMVPGQGGDVESQTLRRRILALLRERELDASDLSQALGLEEKEVYDHLGHVERSVTSSGGKFVMTPSHCLLCGYVFENRKRLTRPSRCPKCKRSKLQDPSYRIE
jgi:transcriptional regulator